MKFEIKNPDKSTYEITTTIPFKKVEETYNHILEHFAEHAKIKGFREGKAPLKEVEKAADKGQIYGEVINHLAPEAYNQAIKEAKIKPIITPRITIKEFNFEDKKDLILEIKTVVKPEVKLPESIKPAVKIAKPGEEKENVDEKQAKALQNLVEKSEVEIPALLVEEEVERSMSRLIDQTERLGLTVDQYMQSVKKNPEILRQEYEHKAKQSLKQEFVMLEVADREKVVAGEKEVEELIAAAGDEKIRQELSKPEHKEYLESVIIKRKVLELISS